MSSTNPTRLTEHMGPHESECPATILDELTETDSAYANAWRDRCRASIAQRKLRNAKPSPKPGQTIIFEEPMRFSDGQERTRFEVIPNPKGRIPLFRDPATRAICRIPGFRKTVLPADKSGRDPGEGVVMSAAQLPRAAAVDGAYGFVLATRDHAHGLSFWNIEYGFGPLFNATVFSETDAIVLDVPIAHDEPQWLALPEPLGTEPRP